MERTVDEFDQEKSLGVDREESSRYVQAHFRHDTSAIHGRISFATYFCLDSISSHAMRPSNVSIHSRVLSSCSLLDR